MNGHNGWIIFQENFITFIYICFTEDLKQKLRWVLKKNDAAPSGFGHWFRNLCSLENIIEKHLFFGTN